MSDHVIVFLVHDFIS